MSTAGAPRPTAYAEVNAVVDVLLRGTHQILGPALVGLYLDGSLAMGDFQADRSDIDFVAVTDRNVTGEEFRALKTLHDRLSAGPSRWGRELEGSYISRQALASRDPRPAAHPYIDRHAELLVIRPETGYWDIHRHVLREHGVTLVGPEPKTLIDPVSSDALRHAVGGVLGEWWQPMLAQSEPLHRDRFGYRCYAVLTMCRMLYTLAHGAIVSKGIAARWAQRTLDARWTPLVEDALSWSEKSPPDADETLALIRFTCERAEDVVTLHNPPDRRRSLR